MTVQSIILRTFILLFGLWAAWFAVAGYLASDDASYAAAANGWLNDFPYVGGSHWSLRQTLVLPMAAVFGLFGQSDVTLLLVSVVYYVALIALCFWWLKIHGHRAAGWLFIVLSSATPGFAALAGTANVDGAETFFILASLMLFLKARDENGRAETAFLLGAGILAGLAFLTRATAVALLVAYGLMFLQGRYHARPRYVVMGIGAFSVYLIDTLYYLIMTGDPLYRLHILTATHINAPPQAKASGNLMEGTLAEPFLAVLVNNEFGLTFFLALVVFWLWSRRRDRAATRGDADWLYLFLFVALVQFIVVGLLMGLRPLPRYFSLSFIPALMMLSVGLPFLWAQGLRGRIITGVTAVMLIGSGLVLTDLSNRDPLFPERMLVEGARANPESRFYAPGSLCRRGLVLSRTDGKGAPLQACDDLSAADTVVIEEGGPLSAADLSGFSVVARLRGAPTLTGLAVRAVGLDHILPLPNRLYHAAPTVLVLKRQRTG